MSYQDPWLDPMETGEMDPAMMEQAMIDYWVANGAGAGMVPDYQMSGKPLTVANQTSALNAYRSSMFDTAFQGLGGPQAFAPGAFDPIVSTSIRQSPELNQMYGYLRAPDSYEGLIANEILNGGNASTALRKIRELLASENTDPALKESLLLELPQRPVEYGMPAPELTVENVNWDADENSVAERSRMINELYAQIPRVGPSEPKWTVGPDGVPVQISAGGELSWGEDESGNPVLMETTVTESEAAKTFSDLGLPNPADEYTMEDFVSPETNAAFEALPLVDDPVRAAMAAMMDPSLRPSNANGPNDRPWVAPANLTEEQLAVHGPGGTQMANRSDADLLNRYLQGSDVVGSEGGRVTEMPNWEVDPYAAEFGGQPIGSSTGVPPVPGIPAGDVQRPGFDYTDWVPPVDRGDEDWVPPTNAVGEVDELGGTYYGNDYTGTGQAATTPTMMNALIAAILGGAAPSDSATPPTQPRPVSASDQLQNQAQAETRAPDWLSHAPGSILTGAGGAQAPNPVTIMGQPVEQYLPQIETGERSARQQREEDEQNAQVLGGSTDRTGKRVRPTRTGQQARAFRAAMDQWHGALDQRNAVMQQSWGNPEFGQGVAQEIQMRRAGVRPLDQALMARRLVLMNAGMPQGI